MRVIACPLSPTGMSLADLSKSVFSFLTSVIQILTLPAEDSDNVNSEEIHPFTLDGNRMIKTCVVYRIFCSKYVY
jgi:hypothetical protein